MHAITSILRSLKKLKSSADFTAPIDTLETEHAEAVAAVGELEAGRESAIFDGGDLAKLEADISAAEGRAKTLNIAMEGARKRREAAIEAEATAALEAIGKAAQKLTGKLLAELISFGKVAEALSDHAKAITSLRREIAGRNTELRTAGRGDLAVDDPIRSLPEIVGRQVHDPVKALVIPEFWPRHPDGPALALLKK